MPIALRCDEDRAIRERAGDTQRPTAGPQVPLQAQLTDRVHRIRVCVFNLAVALQYPQTDGKIKRGPFLWDVGGREVYGYAPARPRKARRLECVLKPFLAFLDCGLSESDNVKSGTGSERDFNLYDNRGNALDNCTSNHLGPPAFGVRFDET